MKNEILRMENISKSFNDVKALNNVKLTLFEGEILGLTGLSSSGKTTLVKILSGVFTMDEGHIYIDNHMVTVNSSNFSRKNGIFYIGQSSMLIPGLSIKENIYSIRTNKPLKLLINSKKMFFQTKDLLKTIGLDFDPDLSVDCLSLHHKYLIQICKAISMDSRIIILDNIVGTYTIKELDQLKYVMKQLTQMGISFIYVNNRLDEIFDISDRITILKEGRIIKTLFKDEYIKDKVIHMLAGYDFKDYFIKPQSSIGKEFFVLEHLSYPNSLNDISFRLSIGEILGLAISEESSRHDLGTILFGANDHLKTEVTINGKKIKLKNPKDAIKHGIGFIPENAINNGLFLDMNTSENSSFLYGIKSKHSFSLINARLHKYIASMVFGKLGLEDTKLDIDQLSNVDKLKLIIHKWLVIKPKVLILTNPTAYLDLLSKQEINALIEEISLSGISILLISSDLSELTKISDRIIILNKGIIRGEFLKEEIISDEELKQQVINVIMSKQS